MSNLKAKLDLLNYAYTLNVLLSDVHVPDYQARLSERL